MLKALTATVLAAALLAGCWHSTPAPPAEPADKREPAPSGDVVLAPEVSGLAVAHVVRDRVYGLRAMADGQRLEAPVNAPLTGSMSPPAVPRGPDGGQLAYNAFRRRRPVIRVHDPRAGRDAVIAEGAVSVAWRADGALAYFQGLKPRVRDLNRYDGHVVVRTGRGAAVRWTDEPARYLVAAWGGERLIAYRFSRARAPDLLVFDGPGRVRVLAERSVLVALSPDGRRALLARHGDAGALVSVVALETGAVEDRLRLDPATVPDASQPITDVASGGSWTGELVVGTTSTGLIVLRVGAAGLSVEQVLTFDLAVFPTGVHEPQLDMGGRRIAAWAELAPRPGQVVADTALLECDRIALRCRQGPPAPGLAGPRLIYDPSRP
jgi:hypothetical protein